MPATAQLVSLPAERAERAMSTADQRAKITAARLRGRLMKSQELHGDGEANPVNHDCIINAINDNRYIIMKG